MKTLPALTGVRFAAALWVVLFHIYRFNDDGLSREQPVLTTVLGPLVSQGDLGVDLFFMLSGFVLAHNYLDRLGPRPSADAIRRFVWLRLARIWPLYMVAILGGGLLLVLREELFGSRAKAPLTGEQLVQQVFMVQQWSAPDVYNTSWATPAWSISAEWLAYLCFPVLAVAVWRLQRHAGRTATLLAAGLVMVPLLWWVAETRSQAEPYMWFARLASEFVCGMLLSAALPTSTPRLRRAGTLLMAPLLVIGAAWLYLAAAFGQPGLGALVIVLFPLLVVSLAYGAGAVQRFFGSPLLVLGGGISFALYLVHSPLIKLYRDVHTNTDLIPLSQDQRGYGELAVAALSVVLAFLLFQYVEEPARRRMRALALRTERPRFSSLWLHPDAAVHADRLPVEIAVRHGLDHHRSQLIR